MRDHSNAPRCTVWLRSLRGSCIASVALCLALLAASIATAVLPPSETVRSMRSWMLQAGLPLLALSMTISSLCMGRLEKMCSTLEFDNLDLVRSRERLYFVASVGVLVSLPSAVLGLLWASGPRPDNDFAIRAIEMISLSIIGALLLSNAVESRSARPATFPPEASGTASDQSDFAHADRAQTDVVGASPAQAEGLLAERSINSMR